ncbi:MAG TPA: glycosyltransferase family A protein [Dehalococcoidia bacterium]|nr:glycosyltransferase family A protein [Dehalococcoidia bacterium]
MISELRDEQPAPIRLGTAEPLVSIGLPVYNGEAFLKQTLDSIQAQTFEDYELIISDNGSDDATEEICRDSAALDRRIHYYRSPVNLGASKNFNRVFQLSRAPYFKWAADDDVIAPEFLERCLAVLEDNPKVALVYPKSDCIDKDGTTLGDYDAIMNHGVWSTNACTRFRQVLREFEFNGGASANVYNFGLIRRSALEQTPLLGPFMMSDLNIVSALSLYGEFVELPEHLLFLRAHPGSSSWFEGASWSQETWQEFFDPSIKGSLALSWSLRRHHVEHARAVLRSPLPLTAKASLLIDCAKPPALLLARKLRRRFMSRTSSAA